MQTKVSISDRSQPNLPLFRPGLMPMLPRFRLLLFFSLFSLSLQSCDRLPELPGAPFSRADAEALTVRIG
ncbi:MAG: hypothetical protein ACO3NK_16920, partial [Prochlorotrichaceae cyanobacterium]